ncbi:hypothetical protein CP533_2121 [Ophiocordyceps camponoti-saundersi (nom. inval.)]|nr:hypothetical protein CP533_2121 [Ophiocordyceps camponoti-saundersi (nom. inval.)]
MAGLTSAQALRTTTTTTKTTKTTTSTTMMERRDLAFAAPGTVCGYIGGDAAFPATCIAGSHCALDVGHGVVGCCPDQGPCTTGVFTSCVDGNSGPQTVSDAYVFTCRGGEVCYRNVFDGGFYQFGCGSESRLATSVATTAPSGLASLDMARVTLAMTESPSLLATPVDVGASFTAAATSLSSGGSDKGVGGGGESPSSTSGPASAPPPDPASPSTGAIVGGTVGGVAALAALFALLVFVVRRRQRRPIKKALMDSSDKKNSNSNNNNNNGDDDLDDDFRSIPYSAKPENSGGKKQAMTMTTTSATNIAAAAAANKTPSSPKATPRFATANAALAAMDADRTPLATSALAFDDPRPAPRPGSIIAEDPAEDEEADAVGAAYPGPRRNGSGALWQQNRRQRRNLVWI